MSESLTVTGESLSHQVWGRTNSCSSHEPRSTNCECQRQSWALKPRSTPKALGFLNQCPPCLCRDAEVTRSSQNPHWPQYRGVSTDKAVLVRWDSNSSQPHLLPVNQLSSDCQRQRQSATPGGTSGCPEPLGTGSCCGRAPRVTQQSTARCGHPAPIRLIQ